ncbi:hypothetical protein D8674_036180 [Pyrus ussuriensis x Pyrus communis]|uniref:Uncharacterized protein n=1 Tax=Pyrus ussuriensis x Pyrus communis TaxID=2448454 RepID=A0A5N5GSW7_9ROSA|nr:hypothetical protein D8674_036180 [Pyrus ussuriensis x Pyrus communis]
MGRRWFLRFLLVSCLLALFSSHGFGRKLMETGEDSSVLVSRENHRKSRKMITVMDYADPEPNVNLRTGYIFTPPPQPN